MGGGGIFSFSLPLSVVLAIALGAILSPRTKIAKLKTTNKDLSWTHQVFGTLANTLESGQSTTARLAVTTRDPSYQPLNFWMHPACTAGGSSRIWLDPPTLG